MRQAVGRKLLEQKGRLRRGELTLFARLLGVETRTLRKWRDQADGCPAMGRPRIAGETWRAALRPVARAWKSQGRSSGLPRLLKRLKEQGLAISTSVARELLRRLKARWRRVEARRRAQLRQHVVVHGRDVAWSLDATHLGSDGLGKVEALVVKDVATTTAIEHSIGAAACGPDVLRLLERARLARGTLPLVLGMDNGPANRNALVCSFLAAERVIVLWNVPHTPEHNAPIESFFGELKSELDASGALWPGSADAFQGPGLLWEAGARTLLGHLEVCVQRAVRVLNQRTRPSRGGLTSAQLDSSLPHAEDLVDRARFYDTACAAIRRAVLGIDDARARRRAEREAVLCTLEQFGLVTRTRGRRPATCSKAERLS